MSSESNALISAGITINFGSALTGEFIDVTKDVDATDQTEVTHQSSPDLFKEFKSAFTDGGVVTVTANLLGNAAPSNPDHGKNDTLVVTIPTPVAGANITMTCKANLQAQGSIDAALGDRVGTELQFKVTSKPVWALTTPP